MKLGLIGAQFWRFHRAGSFGRSDSPGLSRCLCVYVFNPKASETTSLPKLKCLRKQSARKQHEALTQDELSALLDLSNFSAETCSCPRTSKPLLVDAFLRAVLVSWIEHMTHSVAPSSCAVVAATRWSSELTSSQPFCYSSAFVRSNCPLPPHPPAIDCQDFSRDIATCLRCQI